MEQVWIVAGVCVLIGGGIGWLVARFLSRTLLRALWLGLAITFVVALMVGDILLEFNYSRNTGTLRLGVGSRWQHIVDVGCTTTNEGAAAVIGSVAPAETEGVHSFFSFAHWILCVASVNATARICGT